MRRICYFLALISSGIFPACTPQKTGSVPGNDAIRYLALGDSYTIGEAVDSGQRFPAQAVALWQQSQSQRRFAPITYVARTGWTCDELGAAIAQAKPQGPYQVVTLLIGVNDQYRGYPLAQYRPRFATLLRQAIGFAGGDKNRVSVLSIPDYGLTPFAANRNPARIAQELDAYNAEAQAECGFQGIRFVNITGLSRQAATNKSLIAADSLHPSGAQYRLWAQELVKAFQP